MEANEVPEKIYLKPLLMEGGESIMRRCTLKRQNDNQIEYVRKDAFIEKAVKWLKREILITDLSPSNMLDIKFKVFDKEGKKEFIEKFKKYMEE